MPTPPVAACTRTFCPARTPANVNPYSAVKNTTGTPAASTNDHRAGTGVTNRRSTTASEPTTPSRPITTLPTTNTGHARPHLDNHPGALDPQLPAAGIHP